MDDTGQDREVVIYVRSTLRNIIDLIDVGLPTEAKHIAEVALAVVAPKETA